MAVLNDPALRSFHIAGDDGPNSPPVSLMAACEGEGLKCCVIVRLLPGGSYRVELPDLPALAASGASEHEALTGLSHQLDAHLAALAGRGAPPPAFRASAEIARTSNEHCRVQMLIAAPRLDGEP